MKILNVRNGIFASLLLVIFGLWVADRFYLMSESQSKTQRAFEEGLKRQLAVVEQKQSELIASLIEESKNEGVTNLDKFIFGVSTTQLTRLCRYESDIDAGGYERATVSAKRILQAMSCERGSDYVEYARRTARTLLTAKFGEAELDEGFIIGVIGLDSTEEYERFEDFLKRAGDDSVALGDDFGSKMLNAPGGEFRVF